MYMYIEEAMRYLDTILDFFGSKIHFLVKQVLQGSDYTFPFQE